MEHKSSHAEEIDLLELIGQVWQNRRKILMYALWGALVGLIVAISIPSEYTSTVKMAPEQSARSSNMGNLGGLAAMAGFNIGNLNTADGISVDIYPDVISSTPFIAEMSAIPVGSRKIDPPIRLYDYCKDNLRSPWWGAVSRFPMKIVGALPGRGKDRPAGEGEETAIDPSRLTPEQTGVFLAIRKRIGIAIDKKTGIVQASVTLQDPQVAAAVADSLVSKLQRYMIDYRTDKAKRDYAFMQQLYEEAQADYHEKQQRYARFVDANQHLTRESVKVEQSRLDNEQQLAYGVYSNLASQREIARIKVQEQTPSLTVIEPAGVPVVKSNTSRLTILIAMTILGGLVAVAVILFREFFPRREA
jgi:uncharacterized protein involved in exopolysaccharide biosynthesis